MKKFLIRFLPPVAWMGVIFFLSSLNTLPGPQTQEIVWWDFLFKKMAHMIEYGILFYLWQRAINPGKPKTIRGDLIALLIVGLYAISDEYHQAFSPGRHPRIYDVGYDWLGASLMLMKFRNWI